MATVFWVGRTFCCESYEFANWIQLDCVPEQRPIDFRSVIAAWIARTERGVLFSVHMHALRNRSRRGPTVPFGTGDPARTSRPKTQCAPASTDESRAQRERWLQKLDRLRTRGSTGKTGAPLQEILDDIRAER